MRIKNIAWNLTGLGCPLIVAALTVPALIEMIGMQRFGLLALAWSLVGFAGIFDLGIGRATTQAIARLRGGQQLGQATALLKTAVTLSFRTGLIGAILLAIAVLAGAHTNIQYASELNTEVTFAAYLLALAIPIQSMSAMFRGVNEAFENFREISLVRIGLGITNFLGPFLVATFTLNIAALVSTLLLSRLVAFFLFKKFAITCLRDEFSNSNQVQDPRAQKEVAKELLIFGGWFTISSIATPLLMQSDRYLIGTIISAVAVATYTIPFDLVMQSLILAGAITSVIFPNLTALLSSDPKNANRLFIRWLTKITLIMLVVSLSLFFGLQYILKLWIGNQLNPVSINIGKILSIGLVPYTLGTMYVALIHAHGRPDITGKSHLIQIPFFLVFLYWAIKNFGIQGAAWVSVARITVDALIMIVWFYARRR